jgi:outer membrane protein OmpA-like peptidoglycan-associated protein
VKLNNIYYDFNKWNIRSDAKIELNRVYNFLTTITEVDIELRAHTDSRGSDIYNKWLSQKRAESAIKYLKELGVGDLRLTAVGLGETELLNRCLKCSKVEHQLNRRTEFKVIKVNPVLAMVSNKKANSIK